MGRKKKKNVVRCVVCGLTAKQTISVEPVCSNVACHVLVVDAIREVLEMDKNNWRANNV